MVDFSLTDENRLVQQSARAFTEAEILPHIRAWDEDGGFFQPSGLILSILGAIVALLIWRAVRKRSSRAAQ